MKDLFFSNAEESMIRIEAFNQELAFNQIKQLCISHGYTINEDSLEKNLDLLTLNKKLNLFADLLYDNNNWSIKVVRFKETKVIVSEEASQKETSLLMMRLSRKRGQTLVSILDGRE